jgi:hypothetical protein
MDIVFVYQYTCLSASPCAPQVFARVLALTSDSNLRNNSVTLAVPTTVGFKAEIDSLQPVLHRRLAYYRSDAPTFDGTSLFFDPPLTADPSLTVWVPIQTAAGNVWYFDSWADGNRENPRTFDASNGIELSQVRIKFRTANPFGTDPGSLDLVAAPGSNSVSQKLTLYPTDHAGKWSIGTPSASWLAVAAGATNSSDGTAVVTGTVDVRGIAPGFYTASFPVKLVGLDILRSRWTFQLLCASSSESQPLPPPDLSALPVSKAVRRLQTRSLRFLEVGSVRLNSSTHLCQKREVFLRVLGARRWNFRVNLCSFFKFKTRVLLQFSPPRSTARPGNCKSSWVGQLGPPLRFQHHLTGRV